MPCQLGASLCSTVTAMPMELHQDKNTTITTQHTQSIRALQANNLSPTPYTHLSYTPMLSLSYLKDTEHPPMHSRLPLPPHSLTITSPPFPVPLSPSPHAHKLTTQYPPHKCAHTFMLHSIPIHAIYQLTGYARPPSTPPSPQPDTHS